MLFIALGTSVQDVLYPHAKEFVSAHEYWHVMFTLHMYAHTLSVCECIRICVSICIPMYLHTYIHIYIYMCIHTNLQLWLGVYVYIYTRLCSRIHTGYTTCTYIHIYVCLSKSISTYIYIYVYVYQGDAFCVYTLHMQSHMCISMKLDR